MNSEVNGELNMFVEKRGFCMLRVENTIWILRWIVRISNKIKVAFKMKSIATKLHHKEILVLN